MMGRPIARRKTRRKASRYCLDCGLLRLAVDTEGRSNYWCVQRAEHIDGPLLWRRACARFIPAKDIETRREIP